MLEDEESTARICRRCVYARRYYFMTKPDRKQTTKNFENKVCHQSKRDLAVCDVPQDSKHFLEQLERILSGFPH